MAQPASERNRTSARAEIAVAGFALLALLTALAMLSIAFRGTNFAGGDGKMAQAIILAAQKFGGFFQFNNISPIEGLGSQMLPLNVWINPVYWPFAFLDKAPAANVSGVVALAIFAIACYAMARCFDVPMLPSAVAAQLCIVLFGPMMFFYEMSTVFSLMVGNAVVYAPHMVALGLLARLDPGSWRRFCLITAGIFGLLLYSICCDPLWSIVNGWSWALPFAIVAFSPLRPRAVLVRCAALACCVVLLALSGTAEYLYTLVQYTTRVQFPALGDRLRGPDLLASTLFYSPYVKYFYFAWAVGWVLGLLMLRGRARVLVIAGIVTCGVLLTEILVYLLLRNAPWSLPLPVYTEHGLFPLFIASAVAGYWGTLRAVVLWGRAAAAKVIQYADDARLTTRMAEFVRSRALHRLNRAGALSPVWLAKAVAALTVVALVPAALVKDVVRYPGLRIDTYNEPWPHEPEFAQLLAGGIAQAIGRPFRGAVLFYDHDYFFNLTIVNLWVRDVPTIMEYSQLVTPQSVYFNHMVLKNDVRYGMNGFLPLLGPSEEVFSRVLRMLGTRYYVAATPALIPKSFAQRNFKLVATVPQDTHFIPNSEWYVYEVPNPNVGNYTPTQVTRAETGADIAAIMTQPDFDFARQAVLSMALDERLVPARDMQMSLIRGGLHVSGRSEGTSLVVLPQQFSHCLRARDGRVRLVRANLMMTGMIFSGNVDTDIVFDYGIFTPRCRWADLSDIKRLKLQIDARAVPLSGDGLFPDWQGTMAKLRAAAIALK